MSQAGRNETATDTQLAARLVALGGAAPEAVCHVIYRCTRRPDDSLLEGFAVRDEAGLLDAPAFDQWLARQPAGIDRLAVAVLVIRELLDDHDQILQGAIERRRGSAGGPFCGDPARVEFTGAATAVRLFRGLAGGPLEEVPPSADLAAPRVRHAEQFAGEIKALQARFGEALQVLDTREPTLFEDLVGLSGIVHVRAPDGREIGCGIGWHGDTPFVLEAAFPRFDATIKLTDEDAAAVETALRSNRLVSGETRQDAKGVAVVGRRRGGTELFLLRPTAGQVRMEPHTPGRLAAGPDQQRWMHYAETYEGLTVLDAWPDRSGDDVLVLTGDAGGQIWRHHIDVDGVETWRKPENEAAIGALHREKLVPGSLAIEDADQRAGNDNAT